MGWPWCIETDAMVQEGLRDTFRWPVPMHEEYPKLKHNIGKHSQFWAMNRKHAQIVTDDTFIDGLFDRHCYHSISGWVALQRCPSCSLDTNISISCG